MTMTSETTSTETAVAFYNGEYTITNEAGEHKTFRIRRQKDDANFAPKSRIVSLMVGSDNETSYKGFGFANDNGTIYVWKKHQNRTNRYFALLLSKAFEAITESEEETVETAFECAGRQYTVLLSKRCLRCNRKLTNPESIRLGIGPECASKGL
jgi:hypothetical protein